MRGSRASNSPFPVPVARNYTAKSTRGETRRGEMRGGEARRGEATPQPTPSWPILKCNADKRIWLRLLGRWIERQTDRRTHGQMERWIGGRTEERSVLAACCKRIKRLQLPLTASNRYFATLALPLAAVCVQEGERERV